MALLAENELLIRESIANSILAASDDVGYVLPCPIFFNDGADFWATADGASINTKPLIDKTNIGYCVISLIRRQDLPFGVNADCPIIQLTYALRFFRSYDATRSDETVTPNEFLSKNLLSYNKFIAAVMSVFNQFTGIEPIADLPDTMDGNAVSIEMPDFVEEKQPSDYIPEIEGHKTTLELIAQIINL